MSTITNSFNAIVGVFKSSLISSRSFASEVEKPSPAPTGNAAADFSKMRNTHKPNAFEKKVLVWTGKYKNAEEVPGMINQEVMERARNRFRIRVANYLMALTALGCVIMIYSGKQAQSRGETVQQMNLDWHKEYNRKAAEKEQATSNGK